MIYNNRIYYILLNKYIGHNINMIFTFYILSKIVNAIFEHARNFELKISKHLKSFRNKLK